MEKLSHSLKQTSLELVGEVYTDINLSTLSSMLGLDTEQTTAAALGQGLYISGL